MMDCLSTHMGLSLLILLYLCGWVMALFAILREYSPQSALAWALTLSLLPFPTIAFYLALGSGRIRQGIKGPLPAASQEKIATTWAAWLHRGTPNMQAIAKISACPPTQGNQLELLKNGEETYKKLADAVHQAQKSILIEFYTIKDDYIGKKMQNLLIAKAMQGVQVYLIYDEIGSQKLPLGFILRLKRAGVHVSPFHGKRFWLSSILRINYRNHRKLVIVDSHDAWLGGLNVADEYYQSPAHTRWRDTFIHVRGPVVQQAFSCFANDWYRATGQDLSKTIEQHNQSAGQQIAMMIASSPETATNAWLMTLIQLCSCAQKRIWLAAPYLVPNHALNCCLQAAALRGVEVKILIPHKADHRFVQLAMLSYLEELETSGVQVLGYTPSFMHQKILLVDDDYAWVGSANLDMRSLKLNYELACLSYDTKLAKEVEIMLQEDMTCAIPMDSCHFKSARFPTQVAARFCRLFAPLL